MSILDLINSSLKYSFIIIMSFYIMTKIINKLYIKKKFLFIITIVSIFLGILYTLLSYYIPELIIFPILVLAISLCIDFTNKIRIEDSIIISFLSTTMSLAFYILSVTLFLLIVTLPVFNIDKNNPLIFLFSAVIDVILVSIFFNIPRFKNGFSFLKDSENINSISIVGLIFSGALIIFYSSTRSLITSSSRLIGIIGAILIMIGIFIWIKRNITLDYQDRMKNRKIENLEKELADKEKINAELTEEIKSLTMINHQYNSRIKAAKQEIEKLAFAFKNSTNTEFSTELSEVTKLVNNLSSEYSNKVNSVLKYSKPLPKTNVKGVDSILEHMKLESTKKNINFDLKVNCSVKHLIEKFISQSELETLISDHVKDAIIAVGYSESTPRSICVIFDIIDNCYRFSVYDSGIDFEIDTLVNLGLDAITTHKDDGGTGLGFLTTFGTLDKCKASLVIDEINFKNSNFSKSVNIIFDGKHEYIVRSSRTEEIKKSDKNSRIILQNKD